jgi:hypothetical protein
MVLSNDNVTEATVPHQDRMTIDERYKYLRIRSEAYATASRQERGRLLDEMEQVTGLDRKTLIRHMSRRGIERKPRRKQRGTSYGAAVDDALRVIVETLDYICAERLTGNLASLAQQLARHGELQVTPALLAQLQRISLSTVRRRVKKLEHLGSGPLPRRKAPRPANPILRGVPTTIIAWNEPEPGHFENDVVHHCGPIASGDYVHTLQLIDVATAWWEPAALLGRSQRAMENAFRHVLARLPFPVIEIHPDNGSEFFNDHLVRFWGEAIPGVRLSRSRPYHKNDNRFVEQKNSSLIRAYFGNERLDSVAQTLALNQLYDRMWLYYNFFQPVLRLEHKALCTADDGSTRMRRRYGPARTPFERLCATNVLSDEQRQRLESLRDQTNPRRLHDEIHDLIQNLFSLPGARPGRTENVLDTLTMSQPPQKGVGIPVTLSFERMTTVQ